MSIFSTIQKGKYIVSAESTWSPDIISVYVSECGLHGSYTLIYQRISGLAKCIYHDLNDLEQNANITIIDETDESFVWEWRESHSQWIVSGRYKSIH